MARTYRGAQQFLLGGKTALEAALKWLESENDWHRAVIVCDCESLVEATGNPHQTDPIIVTYQRSIARITRSKELLIVWAPGHCNLWGNELADSKPSGDPLYHNRPSGT